MKWLVDFLFRSSIGRKVVMSLSGLFLIAFLVVHLLGNLQLLASDGGRQFNLYAYFMTHNPLIKTVSYLLYLTILLHALQGIALARANRKAKGKSYAVSSNAPVSAFSKYMIHLGMILFIFLGLHMYQFWLQMKMGNAPVVSYPGTDHPVQDLNALVVEAFTNPFYVAIYALSMLALGLHLWHGFQSAFQTLGLNHPKYNGLIHMVGKVYAAFVAVGFAVIPVILFFRQV
ncbi:MAG: succinate dehydrogenase cytochrome b subunit [Saprospiraceae bacterium]|nr:succinate dehydrogenase cytochrome b subunit [Saprospiraceae bacterium]